MKSINMVTKESGTQFHEDIKGINFLDMFSRQEHELLQSMDKKALQNKEYMKAGINQLYATIHPWLKVLYAGGKSTLEKMLSLLSSNSAGEEEVALIQILIKRKFEQLGRAALLPVGFKVDGKMRIRTFEAIQAYGKMFLGNGDAVKDSGLNNEKSILTNGGVANTVEEFANKPVMDVWREKAGKPDLSALALGGAIHRGELSIMIKGVENLRDRKNIEHIVKQGKKGEIYQVVGIRVPARHDKFYYAVVKDKKDGQSFFVCINDGNNVSLQITETAPSADEKGNKNELESEKKVEKYEFDTLSIAKYAAQYYAENVKVTKREMPLCSGYADSVMVQGLAEQGLFFPAVYNGYDAWERGTMFEGKPCKKTNLAECSNENKKLALLDANRGSQFTVQFAGSKHLDKGITHVLIHLGNGVYSHMFGSQVYKIDMKSMPIHTDANGTTYFIRHGKKFNFVQGDTVNTTSYLYSPECNIRLTCRRYTPSARPGTSSFNVATRIRDETGLPHMYCYSVLQEYLSKVGKSDYRELSAGEIQKVSLTLPVGLREKVVKNNKEGVLRIETDTASKATDTIKNSVILAKLGIKIPTDNVALLGAIHNAESGGSEFQGMKEGLYAKSDIAARQYYKNGDAHSLGPYQLQTVVVKKLFKEDLGLRNSVITAINSEYFSIDDGSYIEIPSHIQNGERGQKRKQQMIDRVTSGKFEYNDLLSLLYSPLTSLIIANTLCESDKNNYTSLAEKTGKSISKEDLYLTTMFSYNHGHKRTVNAILQQHLAKIAVSLGVSLVSEEVTYQPGSVAFTGISGKSQKRVNKFINKFIIDGDMGELTAKMIEGINTHLKSQNKPELQITVSKGRITAIQGVQISTDTIPEIAFKLEGIVNNVPFYPVLDGEFLKQNKKQLKAPYGQQFGLSVKYATNESLYRGDEVYTNDMTDRVYSRYHGSVISYPETDPSGFRKNRYNNNKKTGMLDCIGFMHHVAGRLGEQGFDNTYHGLLGNWTEGSVACLTPSITQNYDAYLEAIQSIKPGYIVGIGRIWEGEGAGLVNTSLGKKLTDMSHGGMITRVEKKGGKVVNAYFVHSTSVGMKGPVEVPLFGPGGYYEKVKNDIRKNTIFIGCPKKDFYKNTPTIV